MKKRTINYKTFVTPDLKIIVISSYAGKSVRGVAKCDPRDEFNLEVGKKIAIARCNEKIARKRFKKAAQQHYEATQIMIAAKRYLDSSVEYYDRVTAELVEAEAATTEALAHR